MPRTCSICRHAQRLEIEADLQAGLSYRDVARRYSISKDAVSRHRASHVSLHSTPALATATKIMALLHQAETASLWNITLVTLKEVRRCMEELLMQLKYGIER
jgi:transposase